MLALALLAQMAHVPTVSPPLANGVVAVVALTRCLSLAVAFGAAVSGAATAPLALAFGAGVLAVFNPCGFALLPAFVSYTAGGLGASNAASDSEAGGKVRDDEEDEASQSLQSLQSSQSSLAIRLARGALLGVPLTVGFLLVFLVAGGVLAAGGRALAQVFPWLTLLVGVGLAVLGVRLLLPGAAIEFQPLSRVAAAVSGTLASARRRETATLSAGAWCNQQGGRHGRDGATPRPRRLQAAWAFGLGYGVSSLGCTLPIFLLVVGSAIAAGGLTQAVLVLAAYGAGMAVVLLGVALIATTVGDVLRQTVLPLLRWVQPLSALLILAAGVYIVVYQLRAGLLIH